MSRKGCDTNAVSACLRRSKASIIPLRKRKGHRLGEALHLYCRNPTVPLVRLSALPGFIRSAQMAKQKMTKLTTAADGAANKNEMIPATPEDVLRTGEMAKRHDVTLRTLRFY